MAQYANLCLYKDERLLQLDHGKLYTDNNHINQLEN